MTNRALLHSLLLAAWLAASLPARAERLSLDQAYRLAIRHNPNIAMLRERVAQAEAARHRAWSALKPSASFQGSYTHNDQEIVIDFSGMFPAGITPPSGFPSRSVYQLQDQFAFTVGASLPIFRGPAYPRLSAARTGIEVARLREVRSQQEFLLRVAQAYYQVVSREDAVKALETKLGVDRKHLTVARTRLEVGQAPRSEVLRADLVATQDEQTLLAQRNGVEAARRALAILIGVPDRPQVERPAEPAAPSLSESEMVATAQTARLDLKAADLSIRVARKSVEAVWMSFLPSLDLSWAYRWTEAQGFATNQGMWNLMASLNVPIYDAGLRYADLRDARSRLIEAREQQRALNLDIETEVVRLRSDLASAVAGVVSARKAVTLAHTTLEDMEASFQVGAATQLDVLDASQRLLDAELQLTSSLSNRDLSRLAILHALGRFDPLRHQASVEGR